MGNILQKFYDIFAGNKEAGVLMVGLDNAGFYFGSELFKFSRKNNYIV